MKHPNKTPSYLVRRTKDKNNENDKNDDNENDKNDDNDKSNKK
jgi:hypothetical protein